MPPDRPRPSYYDDLELSLEEAQKLLTRGCADRRSAFHTPAFASVDQYGHPQARTVVMRGADHTSRTLRIHTDVRSGKVLDLAGNQRAAMLFYDEGAKLQLRISGPAAFLSTGPAVEQAWDGSRPMSRLCYSAATAPGSIISAPGTQRVTDTLSDVEARQNFGIVLLKIERIEWLYLAAQGHRRAAWSWTENGWQGEWLQP